MFYSLQRNQMGILLCLACAIAGCGSGNEQSKDRPETFPVQGKVVYKGEPVADALVSFRSKGGEKVVAATGKTDEDGEFQLTTFGSAEGAVAGEHEVTVTKMVVEGEDPSYFDENSPNYGKEPPPTTTKHLVPKKYADFATSGLTATVESSGSNTVTLELSDN